MVKLELAVVVILLPFLAGHPQTELKISKTGVLYGLTTVMIEPYVSPGYYDLELMRSRNFRALTDSIPDDLMDNHVIVFPEYAISGVEAMASYGKAFLFAHKIPAVGETPCPKFGNAPDQILTTAFSCLAAQLRTYVVANLLEVCSGEKRACPKDKLFSTSVAFDRDGKILAKYRKVNTLGDSAVDPNPDLTPVTFVTDFNVKFGLLTSADLMFTTPTVELIKQTQEILVPFAFSGVLPFLTPLQMQYGFWRGVGTPLNMAASCTTVPMFGVSGCSHYYNDQVNNLLLMRFSCSVNSVCYFDITGNTTSLERNTASLERNTAFLVQDIKTNISHGGHTQEKTARATESLRFSKYDLKNFTSKPLQLDLELHNMEVCMGKLCCTIEYQFQKFQSSSHYQFVVYDGPFQHPTDYESYEIKVCGLVACENENVSSCAAQSLNYNKQDKSVFDVLIVTGAFDTPYVLPTTLRSDLFPFGFYNFAKRNQQPNVHEIRVAATEQITNIQTFGLHSHDFKLLTSSGVYLKPFSLVFIVLACGTL